MTKADRFIRCLVAFFIYVAGEHQFSGDWFHQLAGFTMTFLGIAGFIMFARKFFSVLLLCWAVVIILARADETAIWPWLVIHASAVFAGAWAGFRNRAE